MKYFTQTCILLAIASLFAACGGSSAGNNMTRGKNSQSAAVKVKVADMEATANVPMRTLDEIPFEFSWDLELPAPVHRTWVSKSIPDLLFLQTEKKQVHAIDIKSGHTRWVSRALPKLIELEPTVVREELPGRKKGEVVLDDRLYVISDSVLFCLDAIYGQIIWRYALPFEPSTGAYAVGSGKGLRVFIGDWQGHLRVVTYHEEKMNPYVLWQWNLRGAPMADPVGLAGLMYIGNDRGQIQCFDHDRDLKWDYKIGNTMRGAPIIRGRSLYFGSVDNVFHVINRLSGQVMGQMYLDAPIERSPFTFSYDGKRVYVWTEGEGQGIHAIDAIPDSIPYKDSVEDIFPLEVERLKTAWSLKGFSNMVGATKRHLYLTYDADSVLYAVNRKNGDIEWGWNVGETLGVGTFNFCNYVDYTGINQSIITYDAAGKLIAYKLFGQLGK